MSIQLQNGQFIALGKQLYCMAKKLLYGKETRNRRKSL